MDQSAPTPQRCPTAWRVQPVSRELDVIQRADGSVTPNIPKDEEMGWHYREVFGFCQVNQPGHPLKFRRARGDGKPDGVTGNSPTG